MLIFSFVVGWVFGVVLRNWFMNLERYDPGSYLFDDNIVNKLVVLSYKICMIPRTISSYRSVKRDKLYDCNDCGVHIAELK